MADKSLKTAKLQGGFSFNDSNEPIQISSDLNNIPDTPPSTPRNGNVYFAPLTKELFIRHEGQWVRIQTEESIVQYDLVVGEDSNIVTWNQAAQRLDVNDENYYVTVGIVTLNGTVLRPDDNYEIGGGGNHIEFKDLDIDTGDVITVSGVNDTDANSSSGVTGVSFDTDTRILTVTTIDTDYTVEIPGGEDSDTTYTAGYGLNLNDTEFSVDTDVIADTEWVKDYVEAQPGLDFTELKATLQEGNLIVLDTDDDNETVTINVDSDRVTIEDNVHIGHIIVGPGNTRLVDPDSEFRTIAIGRETFMTRDTDNAKLFDNILIGTRASVGAIHNLHASENQFFTENGGLGSIAIGHYARARGNFATAIGSTFFRESDGDIEGQRLAGSRAEGTSSVALGINAWALNGGAVAIQDKSRATGLDSMALGFGAEASGLNSISIGSGTRVGEVNVDDASIVQTHGDNSVSIGNSLNSTGAETLAIGRNLSSASKNTVALGSGSIIEGDSDNIAVGLNNTINGNGLIALGSDNSIEPEVVTQVAIRDNDAIRDTDGSGASIWEAQTSPKARLIDINGTYTRHLTKRFLHLFGGNADNNDTYADATGDSDYYIWVRDSEGDNPAVSIIAGTTFDNQPTLPPTQWIILRGDARNAEAGTSFQDEYVSFASFSSYGEIPTGPLTEFAGGGEAIIADGSEHSIVIGSNHEVSGSRTVAIGTDVIIDTDGAIGMGIGVVNGGSQTLAIGNNIFVTGGTRDSIAIGVNVGNVSGFDSEGLGNFATAVGHNTRASKTECTAVGNAARAIGERSTAIGQNARADTDDATCLGDDSQVTGGHGTAVGRSSSVSGFEGIALGDECTVSGAYGISLGFDNHANHDYSTAIGSNVSTDTERQMSLDGDHTYAVSLPQHTSDPGGMPGGTIYFNTTNARWRGYNGTKWGTFQFDTDS